MAGLQAVRLYSQLVQSHRLASYSYCRRLVDQGPIKPQPARLARAISTSSPSHQSATSDFKPSEVLAKERYDIRSGEEADRKRSRLFYQSRKRGMLENGLILSSFADKYLNTFDADQLDQYDRLINLPTNDWDIYYWATKAKPTPNEFETPVMEKLRDHLRQKVSESPHLFPNYKRPHDQHRHNNEMELEQDQQPQQQQQYQQYQSSHVTTTIFPDGEKLWPIGDAESKLDRDPRTIDISRPETVFVDRAIKLPGNQTMAKMTKWRKDFFIRRIRRTLPTPVSLTGLGDGSNPRYWTHKMKELVDHIRSGIGDRNSNESQQEDLGSLEFSSSLIWMIENEPEVVKRDYREVYELYHKKSELESLKRSIEEGRKKKELDLISTFPLLLSSAIDQEKLRAIEEMNFKAKDLVGVERDDDDASPIRPFLVEGQSPKFAITGQVDNDYDKYLKHRNLLNELFSQQITKCTDRFDMEAEAWTDSMWHRNYGSSDMTIPPSSVPCGGCGAELHCTDPGLPGFLPRELYTDYLDEGKDYQGLHGKKCQRCKFLDTYNVALDVNVSRFDYANLLSQLKQDPNAVILLVVDMLDFPCSVWPGILDIIGANRKVYVVGNKVDLLPKDSEEYLTRMREALEVNLRSRLRWDDRNLHLASTSLISARTGYGIDHLISKLINAHEIQRNIYMVGCSNVGKSTLFNALLQSELCGVRENDIITRASTSVWPGTTLSTLKFPIAKFQGWQMELRKRRLKIQERQAKREAMRLGALAGRRQRSAPHMSQLIHRLEPVFRNEIPLPHKDESDPMVNKVAQIRGLRPFDATSKRFANHSFFHDTPGTNHEDQILDLLTSEELLRVMPRETIVPRTFSLRPLHSLFISGLARLDVLSATSHIFLTVFASNYLPVHIVETHQAERFYYTYLGTPYLGVPLGNAKRLECWPELLSHKHEHTYELRGTSSGWKYGLADIVLSNAGWVLLTTGPDQDCIVRAYTPEARGIYRRDTPLLPEASQLRGRRIRDTPCFRYPRFSIEQRSG